MNSICSALLRAVTTTIKLYLQKCSWLNDHRDNIPHHYGTKRLLATFTALTCFFFVFLLATYKLVSALSVSFSEILCKV